MTKHLGQILVETLIVVGFIFGSLFLYLRLTSDSLRSLRRGCKDFHKARESYLHNYEIPKNSCHLGAAPDPTTER